MRETQFADGLREALRLMRIELIRLSGRHIAERASARTDRTQNHESRMLVLPAFANIGARRFLAYGDELELAHQIARLVIFATDRRLDADPIRLRRRRIVGPVDF